MFRVAICDNEAVICSSLEDIVLKYARTIEDEVEIELFYSGEKLINYLSKENRFDLIFLDIEMDGMNGVEVGRKIRKEMNDYATQIIYVSGQQGYAMQLFQNQPLNFILKPIDEKLVIEYLDLARVQSENNSVFFEFSIQREYHRISFSNILYLQSDNKKIHVFMNDKTIEFNGKLSDYSKLLLNNHFMQIHKSYFVNYQYVAHVHYDSVTLSNGKILSISQPYRKGIRDILIKKRKKELENVCF